MSSLANCCALSPNVSQPWFAHALPLKLYEINRLWNRSQRGGIRSSESGQLIRLAHDLKRSADIYGCRQLSKQAAGLEHLFQTLRFTPYLPSSRQIVEIALSLDTLDDAAHEVLCMQSL